MKEIIEQKRNCTKVTAFVGLFGLDEQFVEILLSLGVELDQLVNEQHPQTHSQQMLPRI